MHMSMFKVCLGYVSQLPIDILSQEALQKHSTVILVAAISGWSFLLTTLERWELDSKYWQGYDTTLVLNTSDTPVKFVKTWIISDNNVGFLNKNIRSINVFTIMDSLKHCQ